MRNVILGAGPAGVVAAETLRAEDPTCEITLLHGEADPPYARMTLPYLLSGVLNDAGMRLRKEAGCFERQRIDLVPGRTASVDVVGKTLTLQDGSQHAYDQLLVATGSRPKPPPFAGLSEDGVQHCWTLPQAREVLKRARDGARVVQIGAGFVACIVMKALVSRGVSLTVVTGRSGQLMRSMICPTASALLQARCESRGVRFVAGDRVAGIAPGPVVELASGQRLEADLVLVATGVEANVSFLDPQAIAVDDGVVVDHRLRSSVPGIWAAGDVAQGRVFGNGAREVHPTQPTAVDHGRVAGLGLAGRDAGYTGSLRMNVIETMGLTCCSLGQWDADHDELESAERSAQDRERFVRLTFAGDRVVGANLVGLEHQVGALRGLIQSATPLGPWRARLQQDPSRFAEAFVARAQGL